MKWVTRERPKTDRIACPWLIKNFIDPEAEFLYVPAGEVLEVAERKGAHSYDAPMRSTRTATGFARSRCWSRSTSSTIPALVCWHASCTAPTSPTTATPQSRGLLAVAEGFYLLNLDDHRQLELSLPVYDALYAWCKHEVARDESG